MKLVVYLFVAFLLNICVFMCLWRFSQYLIRIAVSVYLLFFLFLVFDLFFVSVCFLYLYFCIKHDHIINPYPANVENVVSS